MTLREIRQAVLSAGGSSSDALTASQSLSRQEQDANWMQLRERVAARRKHERAEDDFWSGYDWPESERPAPRLRAVPSPRRYSIARTGDDVLDSIPPPLYFEALTGEAVPSNGRVHCPVPGHVDRNPSCIIYSEPGRGWYCPVCGTGGSAIDLAYHLTGIEPRGKGYMELRRIVASRLLGREAA